MESFRSSIIFVGGWIKYASAGCRDTSFPISFEAIHVDFDLYVWNSMSNFHKDIFGSFFCRKQLLQQLDKHDKNGHHSISLHASREISKNSKNNLRTHMYAEHGLRIFNSAIYIHPKCIK